MSRPNNLHPLSKRHRSPPSRSPSTPRDRETPKEHREKRTRWGPPTRWSPLSAEDTSRLLGGDLTGDLCLHRLVEVELRFTCGETRTLSISAAVDLLKLRNSLLGAIVGGPSAGVCFEVLGAADDACARLRAVVMEPMCLEFSYQLFRAIEGGWMLQSLQHKDFLEAKTVIVQ